MVPLLPSDRGAVSDDCALPFSPSVEVRVHQPDHRFSTRRIMVLDSSPDSPDSDLLSSHQGKIERLQDVANSVRILGVGVATQVVNFIGQDGGHPVREIGEKCVQGGWKC
jgi:hypothetical protein